MYSFLLESAIKDETHYQFFVYKGKTPVKINFRGKEYQVRPGTKFGVRPATSKTGAIRLIFPGEPNRVFTLDPETAQKLARGVK